MNAKMLAEQLNGLEYPPRIPKQIIGIAKTNRLVIVYGASDDLMELEGSINNEVGCYEGCSALVDKQGLVPLKDDVDFLSNSEDALHEWLHRKKDAKTIKACWGKGGCLWVIETDIPHETFNIMEYGKFFCRGIVFSLDNLG